MDTIYLKTLSSPIEVDDRIAVPGFTLVQSFLSDCSQNYTTGTHADRTFNFSLSEYQHNHVIDWIGLCFRGSVLLS